MESGKEDLEEEDLTGVDQEVEDHLMVRDQKDLTLEKDVLSEIEMNALQEQKVTQEDQKGVHILLEKIVRKDQNEQKEEVHIVLIEAQEILHQQKDVHMETDHLLQEEEVNVQDVILVEQIEALVIA